MSKPLHFLILLSITIINPFASNDYDKFILPKLYILFLITIYLFTFCIQKIHSKTWIEWSLFLGWGTLSTLHSSFPIQSVLGVGYWGDGLLYWVLCGVMYVGMETCIYHRPQAFYNLDIPILTGISLTLLPLGLYARPGHHAYVIGLAIILLTLEGFYTGIGTIALMILGNRAVILGIVAAFFPKLWKRFKSVLIVAIVVLLAFTSQRQITNNDAWVKNQLLRNITSDRINLIQNVILPDINPIFGKGFNGLAIRRMEKPQKRSWINSAKTHNIFTDTYISLGIPGLVFYLLLLIQILKPLPKELIIYHSIFLLFWYDCAQYTHLLLFISLMYRTRKAAPLEQES